MPKTADIHICALAARRQDWPVMKFGDVVRNVSETCRDPQADGLDRYLGLEHIDSDNLHIKRWGLLAEDDVSFTRRFRKGQVLFGKRRAYLKKVAVAEFDGICSSDILCFESKDPKVLLPDLLPFIVQSDGFFAHALGTSSGSLSPRTRWPQLKEYTFPLPPLDQQRRIAQLLWAAEEVAERYQEAEGRLSVLETAIINTFAREYAETHDLTPMKEIIEDGRPITYGILKPGLTYEGGIPVIKVRDYPEGHVIESGLLLTSPEIESEYKRSQLNAGDLLISIRGTVGRLAEVPPSLQDANITQDTARLSIKAEHNKHYVRGLLARLSHLCGLLIGVEEGLHDFS